VSRVALIVSALLRPPDYAPSSVMPAQRTNRVYVAKDRDVAELTAGYPAFAEDKGIRKVLLGRAGRRELTRPRGASVPRVVARRPQSTLDCCWPATLQLSVIRVSRSEVAGMGPCASRRGGQASWRFVAAATQP
jgi:hypothetical protein